MHSTIFHIYDFIFSISFNKPMLKYIFLSFFGASAITQCGEPSAESSTSIVEDFEDKGTKGKYEAAEVAFKSGNWLLDNALVGTDENDAHNGFRSLRIKQGGMVTPSFALSGTVNTVSFQYATYKGKKDAEGSLEVWISTDKGSTWAQAGDVLSANSPDFAKATININKKNGVMLQFRNTSRKGCRINIDDVSINGNNIKAESVTITPSIADAKTEKNEEYNPNTEQTPRKPRAKKEANAAVTVLAQEHLVLGNPSGATANEKDYDNYLMQKDEYSVSYNRSKGSANWVAWRCAAYWNGTTQRSNDFRPDPELPQDWYHASTKDYAGSGFDRGHLCSSGDRDNNATNNSATFLMTNIVPQAPNNNQGAWNALELYVRGLADNGNEVYCFAGGYGRGGEGKSGKVTTLADGQLVVPATMWKVVIVLPEGENDASRITKKTQAFAIKMPNNQSIGKENWRDFVVPIDEIERITGYDFLSNVPKDIQAAIEAARE
jgi:endonuclease G, mitochondrial